jgi:hypothetical protein
VANQNIEGEGEDFDPNINPLTGKPYAVAAPEFAAAPEFNVQDSPMNFTQQQIQKGKNVIAGGGTFVAAGPQSGAINSGIAGLPPVEARYDIDGNLSTEWDASGNFIGTHKGYSGSIPQGMGYDEYQNYLNKRFPPGGIYDPDRPLLVPQNPHPVNYDNQSYNQPGQGTSQWQDPDAWDAYYENGGVAPASGTGSEDASQFIPTAAEIEEELQNGDYSEEEFDQALGLWAEVLHNKKFGPATKGTNRQAIGTGYPPQEQRETSSGFNLNSAYGDGRYVPQPGTPQRSTFGQQWSQPQPDRYFPSVYGQQGGFQGQIMRPGTVLGGQRHPTPPESWGGSGMPPLQYFPDGTSYYNFGLK